MITDSEKNIYYEKMLEKLKVKCDSLSFTLDGRPGLRKSIRAIFKDAPIQLCQVHFSRNIRKYTTTRPKTDCGQDLYNLAMSVTHLQEEEFIDRFKEIEDRYSEFLKERNKHKQFKHRRLRSAMNAFRRDIPYLFTCQKFPHLKIENTTNSCEGYFSHLKKMVNVHPGLSPLKEPLIKGISLISF
jgi:transposase-like protein